MSEGGRSRHHGRSLTDESVYHKRNDDGLGRLQKIEEGRPLFRPTLKLRRSASSETMICVRAPANRESFHVCIYIYISTDTHLHTITHFRTRGDARRVRIASECS